MFIPKTAVRNRGILAAHQQGDSIRELARRHGLSEITVHQIITGERNKVAVSVDAFYKEMRSRKLHLQS
jgi:Mor family transcriptional regulator